MARVAFSARPVYHFLWFFTLYFIWFLCFLLYFYCLPFFLLYCIDFLRVGSEIPLSIKILLNTWHLMLVRVHWVQRRIARAWAWQISFRPVMTLGWPGQPNWVRALGSWHFLKPTTRICVDFFRSLVYGREHWLNCMRRKSRVHWYFSLINSYLHNLRLNIHGIVDMIIAWS